MAKEISTTQPAESYTEKKDLTEVKIYLPDDLARAWQRCNWALVNDAGRERLDIMKEMVTDYLIKHGC